MQRILPFILCVFILASCVEVEDFGEYWNSKTEDLLLEGKWENLSTLELMTVSREGDHYRFSRNPERPQRDDIGKVLVLGDHRFLMMRAHNGFQSLWKYSTNEKELIIYRNSKDKKNDFISNYQNDNFRIDEDRVVIHKLDKDTVDIIRKIASQEDYWEMSVKYRLVEE